MLYGLYIYAQSGEVHCPLVAEQEHLSVVPASTTVHYNLSTIDLYTSNSQFNETGYLFSSFVIAMTPSSLGSHGKLVGQKSYIISSMTGHAAHVW